MENLEKFIFIIYTKIVQLIYLAWQTAAAVNRRSVSKLIIKVFSIVRLKVEALLGGWKMQRQNE